MKSRCLLIGGSGFIGSHLTRRLAMSGRFVTVLDRVRQLDADMIANVTYETGDFSDIGLIERLVEGHDEIIHLAYATVPNTSYDDPLADLTQNLSPAVQLFDVVAKKGARLLLVSSGGTVYGEAVSVPISEEHSTRPISPYGVTKLTLEKYAYLYAVTRGLQVICVRPANPYGEGQRPFSGQGFVSTAMAAAIQGRAITIYGDEGTVRDYIHIDDLVDGMMVVLEHGECGEPYNIGRSIGLSNLQVVQAMTPLLKEIGVDVHIEYAEPRPFDVKVNILDCTKLREFGWVPCVGFEEGLRRTLAWLKQ